jgi:4-hydroxybenzoate polyprenyltransferase
MSSFSSSAFALVKLARPKHWVKNSFVFAPLFFSGRFTDMDSVLRTVWAFSVFCLAASATYVLNDIRDVAADRLHPKKSLSRPIAVGTVSVRSAWIFFAALLVAITAMLIPYQQVANLTNQPNAFFGTAVTLQIESLGLVILAYLILNLAYTFYLKRLAIIDIFAIAAGFVLRVFAGAISIEVAVSNWMFVTTLCLALFFASMKRLQEVKSHGTASRAVLETYSQAFIERIVLVTGTLTIAFYGIFTLTDRPVFIASIPVVLFAMLRYWHVADVVGAGESPTDLVLKDKQILVSGLLLIGICVYALTQK